jgi:probable F420-dependent oxidoreductase
VKVETGLPFDLSLIAAWVPLVEEVGYDGVMAPEVGHDPLLALALAAEHSTRVTLATNVLIAFPRAPMVVAQAAWDLQRLSRGRVTLGLGSQVKGHIMRRYQTQWLSPAARMSDYVRCLQAIWQSWQTGNRPDHQGPFYQYTLMTPNFDPGPLPFSAPKVMLSAVNRRMAELAGELCDGIRLHGFNTPSYLRDVILPAVEKGLANSGRRREQFEVNGANFVATGRTHAEVEQAFERVREQIAFYGSTRTYRPVLDHHGWADLGERLHQLSLDGKWKEMPQHVTDDVAHEFSIVGTFDELPKAIEQRFGGLIDCLTIVPELQERLGLPLETTTDRTLAKDIMSSLHGIPSPLLPVTP